MKVTPSSGPSRNTWSLAHLFFWDIIPGMWLLQHNLGKEQGRAMERKTETQREERRGREAVSSSQSPRPGVGLWLLVCEGHPLSAVPTPPGTLVQPTISLVSVRTCLSAFSFPPCSAPLPFIWSPGCWLPYSFPPPFPFCSSHSTQAPPWLSSRGVGGGMSIPHPTRPVPADIQTSGGEGVGAPQVSLRLGLCHQAHPLRKLS